MVHAAGCKAHGDQVKLMVALEMLGYYSNEPGSQRYPEGRGENRTDIGNFVAFVGATAHAQTTNQVVAAFNRATGVPTETLHTPVWSPDLVRSDHYAFVLNHFPALLVTDTADFRNPNYHSENDTPGTLDYAVMAGVTSGLVAAFGELVGDAKAGE